MDTLLGVRVFCTVAELRSFVAAADRLGLSPQMVSKHVMRLEDRLGSRLLNRSTRRVSLTENGLFYYNQSKQLIEAFDDAEAAVSNTTLEPRGTLKVVAPIWVASRRFSRFIADYHASYPEVCFEFHLTDRLTNLVEDGFDLALRATARPEALDSGLIIRPIADVVFHLVAAPSYLERTGRPVGLSDLSDRSLLVLKGAGLESRFKFEGARGPESVKFSVVMESSNEGLLHSAALEGLGMTFLPRLMVEADLQSGDLEEVLPGSAHIVTKLYAIYPSREHLSAKVRTFIDMLAKVASEDALRRDAALAT